MKKIHWLIERIKKKIQPFHRQQLLLLLDIDGTLAEFQLQPEHSFIHPNTLETLKALNQLTLLCFVTGRSVQQAKQLLGPLNWNIVGSHGAEFYLNQKNTSPELPLLQSVHALHQDLAHQASQLQPLLLEFKPYSIALHYRQHPELASFARKTASKIIEKHPIFSIKAGKFVYEIIPTGINKGDAIADVYQRLNPQSYPIFIGDDLTDETGFSVINRLGGLSLKVGDGETLAQHRLSHVDDVGFFLHELLITLQGLKQEMQGEHACQNSLSYPTV